MSAGRAKWKEFSGNSLGSRSFPVRLREPAKYLRRFFRSFLEVFPVWTDFQEVRTRDS